MNNAIRTTALIGPFEDCAPDTLKLCVENRCSCISQVNMDPPAPRVEMCVMTIGYPVDRPDLPSLELGSAKCAMSAEVALAVAAAALLKAISQGR